MHTPRLVGRFGRFGAVGRLGGALAVLAGALLPATAEANAQPAPTSPAPAPQVLALPQHAGPPGVRTVDHPLMVKVQGHDAKGRPLLATGAPGGYTAAQLRATVNLKGTGKGQTVAIVDAFDDPYAAADLDAYSTQMGLPGICTRHRKKGCFTFTQVAPFGIGGYDPGWSGETSLDIEMVHALAPDAHIVLVEAYDNTDEQMYRAVDYAAALHPAAISNSWGVDGAEDPAEATLDHHCELADGVCVFSTGDAGNPGGYPAYNPHVLSVGGTTLDLDRAGTVLSETAWSGSGGGVSTVEPRPAYQPETLNPNQGRGIPDVSFDADPFTGVAVYFSGLGGWLEIGGTSAGAPAWAGILAATDQLRAAAHRPALTAAGDEVQNAVYHLTDGLSDVTSGSNGACGDVCTAGPGYDFVTGLGSPRPGIDTALAAAP